MGKEILKILKGPSKCPRCNRVVKLEDYICKNCGKVLRKKLPSLSLLSLSAVYLGSLLFPPFGMLMSIRYLKVNDDEYRSVGVTAMILTAISVILIATVLVKMYYQVEEIWKYIAVMLENNLGL